MSDRTPPQSYPTSNEDPAIEDDYSAMPYSADTSQCFDLVARHQPDLSNTDFGLLDFDQTFLNDPGLIPDKLIGLDSGTCIDPRQLTQVAYVSPADGADRDTTSLNQQSGQLFQQQSGDGSAYTNFDCIIITHAEMLKLMRTNEFWLIYISENELQCPICYKIYTRRDVLKRHVRSNKQCKKAWNRKTPGERFYIVFGSPSRSIPWEH